VGEGAVGEPGRKKTYHLAGREIRPTPGRRICGAAIEAATADTVAEFGGSIVGVDDGDWLGSCIGVVGVLAVMGGGRMHGGDGELGGRVDVGVVVAVVVMVTIVVVVVVGSRVVRVKVGRNVVVGVRGRIGVGRATDGRSAERGAFLGGVGGGWRVWMVGRKSGNGGRRVGGVLLLLIADADIDGHVAGGVPVGVPVVVVVAVVGAQGRIDGVVVLAVRVSLPGRARQSPSRFLSLHLKTHAPAQCCHRKKTRTTVGAITPLHHHSFRAPLQHGFSADLRSPTLWPTREGANAYWIGPMPICLVLPLPFTSLQHVSST